MNYGYVVNNQILKIGLPKSWTNKNGQDISGFDLLSTEELQLEDWFPIVDERPEHDQATQYIQQYGYIFDVDKIKVGYNIFDIQQPVVDLAQVKSERLSIIGNSAVNALKTFQFDGLTFENSGESKSNLLYVQSIIQANPAYSTKWRVLNGTYHLGERNSILIDATNIMDFAMAMATHNSNVINWQDSVEEQLNLATTIEEINAVEMNYM